MIFFKKYRQPFRPPWPRIEKTTSKNVVFSILETRTGVEPVNVGFADRCVTASPPGQTVAHFTLSFIVLISKPNSVLGRGLEPPRITPLVPKTSAATNYATRAHYLLFQT